MTRQAVAYILILVLIVGLVTAYRWARHNSSAQRAIRSRRRDEQFREIRDRAGSPDIRGD